MDKGVVMNEFLPLSDGFATWGVWQWLIIIFILLVIASSLIMIIKYDKEKQW